ncbi:hypothetical protein EV715DRAFT_296221 [Schizophyllum commune]
MADPFNQKFINPVPLLGPRFYQLGTGRKCQVAPGDFYHFLSLRGSTKLHIPPFNDDNDDSDSEVDCAEAPRPTQDYMPDAHGSDASRPPSPEVDSESLDEEPGPGYAMVIGHADSEIFTDDRYTTAVKSNEEVTGTELVRFFRCPSDFGNEGTWIAEYIRWPEVVASYQGCYRTRTLLQKMFVRIVLLYENDRHEKHKNHLVVDSGGKPAFPPCDENDIWARYYLPEKSQLDILSPPPEICLEHGCRQSRLWDVKRCGQIRYCPGCDCFWHVQCLGDPMYRPDVLRTYGDRLATSEQPYMLYLNSSEFKTGNIRIRRLKTNSVATVEQDIHDRQRRVTLPKDCRWREIAALPIRRRTSPGRTPLTNEVLIRYARERVLAGHGADKIPNLHQLLITDGLCPQAAVRGAKYILVKDLRKLRGDTMRFFTCPKCKDKII